MITGWTPHTPNEVGAAICDVGSAVDGLRCRGRTARRSACTA
ncbi:hypothetical protein [Nannocystis pusilla]